jgi:hypothetical protein
VRHQQVERVVVVEVGLDVAADADRVVAPGLLVRRDDEDRAAALVDQGVRHRLEVAAAVDAIESRRDLRRAKFAADEVLRLRRDRIGTDGSRAGHAHLVDQHRSIFANETGALHFALRVRLRRDCKGTQPIQRSARRGFARRDQRRPLVEVARA